MNGKLSGQHILFYRHRLTVGPISALYRPGPALNNAQSAAIMRDVQRYAGLGIAAAIQCNPLINKDLDTIKITNCSRYLPSVNIGEYRAGTERPEDGGLYPLEDPGTYGAVPKQKHPGKWSLPQAYIPRCCRCWINNVMLY